MRVALATVQVPFIRGGAEAMTAGLANALEQAGHTVESVTLPFRFGPPDAVLESMAAWKRQDFERFDCGSIDRVIALKFPAYYLHHPNKTVWLMHQHRAVYELFGTPYGERADDPSSVALRDAVVAEDTACLRDARRIFTLSRTVSDRLQQYNGVDSMPLYQPPPHAETYRPGAIYPYIFCPSRLEDTKRQELLIQAMQAVAEPVMAIIAGEGGRAEHYRQLVEALGLQHRVQLVGRLDAQSLRRYYSNALAVFFAPYAEDYGFITLEAMLSAKPVITCTDSGGPTEFVVPGETGYVVAPQAEAVADACNRLWAARSLAQQMGNSALEHYRSLDLHWSKVVDRLLEDPRP